MISPKAVSGQQRTSGRRLARSRPARFHKRDWGSNAAVMGRLQGSDYQNDYRTFGRAPAEAPEDRPPVVKRNRHLVQVFAENAAANDPGRAANCAPQVPLDSTTRDRNPANDHLRAAPCVVVAKRTPSLGC